MSVRGPVIGQRDSRPALKSAEDRCFRVVERPRDLRGKVTVEVVRVGGDGGWAVGGGRVEGGS